MKLENKQPKVALITGAARRIGAEIACHLHQSGFRVVIHCYQSFIRGLLDLTDNINGQKINRPKNVVCHDDIDPYLVVAADKGTATFSDIANQLAKEYDFFIYKPFLITNLLSKLVRIRKKGIENLGSGI